MGTAGYSGANYYPFLLAAVKVGLALMLARLAWRFVKATRVLQTSGARYRPKVRIELSPKLWLGSFLATSVIYLMQMDAEGISAGRWPLLAPWLHTFALPVFAVLSVVVAVVYRAVEQWLAEYETFAYESARRAARVGATLPAPRPSLPDLIAPRSLFGVAFEVRPPPAFA